MAASRCKGKATCMCPMCVGPGGKHSPQHTHRESACASHCGAAASSISRRFPGGFPLQRQSHL